MTYKEKIKGVLVVIGFWTFITIPLYNPNLFLIIAGLFLALVLSAVLFAMAVD